MTGVTEDARCSPALTLLLCAERHLHNKLCSVSPETASEQETHQEARFLTSTQSDFIHNPSSRPLLDARQLTMPLISAQMMEATVRTETPDLPLPCPLLQL